MPKRLRIPAFSQSDFGWSYLLMALVAITLPVLTIIRPLVQWIRGSTLVTSVMLPHGMDLTTPLSGARVWESTLTVEIAQASTTAWLAHLGRGVLLTAVVWWVLYLLGRLLRSVQDGTPFRAENVTRLRVAGVVVMAGAIVWMFYNGLINPILLGEVVPAHGVMWLAQLSYGSLLVVGFGVLLTVVAEVFQRGVRLEEDAEGVI
ncbi:DUF2975 domain-containing protein [Enemella sp. A6]|uniref:DUF2975 domain-containing protein n=1 Tax=Enemella sp. A6 TaxID=3440152 RepID=UPI003EBB18BB